jgi:hypothetical protein
LPFLHGWTMHRPPKVSGERPKMIRMCKRRQVVAILAAILLASGPVDLAAKKGKASGKADTELGGPSVLWHNPTDIASRNLFYGPGGEQHAPHTRYTFVKEDLDGTSPKFVVRDENGVKWKVKLGEETRPEVVASRLVWAVGYFTNEDYFLPELHVEDMPLLHRGQNLVEPGGTVRNVRLKRYLEGEKKIGSWSWRRNPFTGTRELNGLRVMMALINNWDLKDENNSLYWEARSATAGNPERRYEVSDLGASFGTTGRERNRAFSKGNLDSYRASRFIRKETPEYVDFTVPARPALKYAVNPREFFSRLGLRWIGRNIPRQDARWTGELLGQLSPDQIRDSFRAAGYSPREVEGFAGVVEQRIAELKAM